jgi:hypothetical protein
MDDKLPEATIITLSFETHTNKDQLTMGFAQLLNVIRRVNTFALSCLMHDQAWDFHGRIS